MKRISLSLLCLLVAMVAVSCSESKEADSTSAIAPTQKAVTVVKNKKAAPEMETPMAVSPDAQNNDFSFRLWAKIDQEGENVFFSPYSINTALAMVYNGAKGNTAKQIAGVMGYDFAPDQAHPSLIKTQKQLNSRAGSDQAEVKVANAVFTSRQSQNLLVPEYVTLLQQHYFAKLFSLDFGKAKETADFINQWIEDNTNNRIKNMVDEDQVRGSNDGLFLANALFFKAKWQNQFKERFTKEDTFYTSSAKREEESKKIDMMQTEAYFAYAQIPGAQLLEMPYEDSNYSMLVVLPDEMTGFTQKLSPTVLETWQSALGQPIKVDVFLPRFKVEFGLDQLTDTFKSMGMKDAFNPATADFTNIMRKSDSNTNLFISKIAHKAFLQVQENGTEAAAATVVSVMRTSVAPPDPAQVQFRADKPFLCLILHKPDNTLLFAGKIIKPDAAEPDAAEK